MENPADENNLPLYRLVLFGVMDEIRFVIERSEDSQEIASAGLKKFEELMKDQSLYLSDEKLKEVREGALYWIKKQTTSEIKKHEQAFGDWSAALSGFDEIFNEDDEDEDSGFGQSAIDERLDDLRRCGQ